MDSAGRVSILVLLAAISLSAMAEIPDFLEGDSRWTLKPNGEPFPAWVAAELAIGPGGVLDRSHFRADVAARLGKSVRRAAGKAAGEPCDTYYAGASGHWLPGEEWSTLASAIAHADWVFIGTLTERRGGFWGAGTPGLLFSIRPERVFRGRTDRSWEQMFAYSIGSFQREGLEFCVANLRGPGELTIGQQVLMIVGDLDRNRFHFGGIDDAVQFDLDANGVKEWVSWTHPDHLDGFLVLDRDGNGTIDSGAEMFGDHTPLVRGGLAEHGYIALAQYDRLELGGNGNGRIDSDDAIYPRLRVWIDADHDGISAPGEMTTLASWDLVALGLEANEWKRIDTHGNFLRWIGEAWQGREGERLERVLTVDVFLKSLRE